jgi:hypothetical protein
VLLPPDLDLLDCRRHAPILVVFMGRCATKGLFATVYSSEDGAWKESVAHISYSMAYVPMIVMLMGNTLYFASKTGATDYSSTI